MKFTGQVTQKVRRITYRIDMKRIIDRKLIMGIGDGVVEADGKPIYEAADLRVGLFRPEDLS